MITLRLLGGASLEAPDGPLTGRVAQRRPLALLALLAVDRARALSRDRLLLLLAPELDTDRARHLLRDTVYAVRSALGNEVILAAGDELRLDRSRIGCDVWDFETALERGDVDGAARLRAGRLLEGFHLPESPEFDSWAAVERGRLDGELARELERAAQGATDAGDLTRAVRLWTERVALDPASAGATQGLMRAMAAAGDVSGAVRQASHHAAHMRTEFGTGPDPGVEALLQALREAAPPPLLAPARQVPSAVIPPGTMRLPSRTHRRWWPLVAAGVAGLALVLAWNRRPPAGPSLEPRRVAVAPLQNATGDATLDGLGGMIADWVIEGLVRSELVEVVPVTTTLGLAGRLTPPPDSASGGSPTVAVLAHGTGSRFVIHGRYYREGGQLHIQVQVTDAASGVVVRSVGPVTASVDDPMPAVEELRQRVLAGLAPILDPRLEATARAASQPPTFAAYRTFADGLEAFIAGDFARAAERFERAVALDTSYTHAKIWTAVARWNAGDHFGADSVVRGVDTTGASLAPLDEVIRRSILAWAAGDWATAYEMAVRGAQAAPGSGFALAQTAVEARRLRRPGEARRILTGLDPDRGELAGWVYYWQDLAEARHLLGDHRAELRDAEEARRRHPDHHVPHLLLVRVHAALGRPDSVIETLAQARGGPAAGFYGGLSREAASELLAHGHHTAAEQVIAAAAAWYRERLAGDTLLPAARGLARLLLLRPGAEAEARQLLAQLPAPPRAPAAVDHPGLLAYLSLRSGDDAAATAWLDVVAALRVPMINGRDAWWRAALLAARGDCPRAVVAMQDALGSGVEYGMELHHAGELAELRRCPGAERLLRPAG